jgi:SAM-dependent methyltransferase
MSTPKTVFSGEEGFEYPAHDLDAMESAGRYYDFLVEQMLPFLGEHIVEVGAGRGTFAQKLLQRHTPKTFRLIEPDQRNVESARDLLAEQPGTAKLYVHHGFSTMFWGELEPKPDTIIYVNVLEHVADDVAEIKDAMRALSPGGHIIAFSPAMPVLYSGFDHALGHYRRYTLMQKKALFEQNGLAIRFATYMDIPGFFAWFAAFRILRRKTLSATSVKLYDTLIFPLLKIIEPLPWFPFGKNVFIAGQKR